MEGETDLEQPLPKTVEEIEQLITHLLSQSLCLKPELIDREVNLFDLGMDSLHAVELFNRLGESLRMDVPVIVIFEHPTVASLAGFIGDTRLGNRD